MKLIINKPTINGKNEQSIYTGKLQICDRMFTLFNNNLKIINVNLFFKTFLQCYKVKLTVL
jgi:hypothetical protein